LARAQFAFTVAFHITFPAFTIGLASWLAVVEWRWLKTGNPSTSKIYRMWVKIFAVTFGMGVVTGVVLSYQFGTNWSVFADQVGNVLGPLLGYEVLTAFFLEASFLGIMLFGWNRVSRRMHFAATVIVACGHPDFGLLDPVGQQLDADAGGLPRGRRRPALPDRLARGDLQPVVSLPHSSTWSRRPT
jgi:cytochrome bd-type quinol oxidase subunit 1